MSFDYSGLLTTANTLIARFGRAITLTRDSRTPADVAKPWAARAVDTDTQSITTIGVFLDPARSDFTLGDVSSAEDRRARVLVPAEPTLPEEMGPEWRITDGTLVYEMVISRPIKPGGTLLYYELEARM